MYYCALSLGVLQYILPRFLVTCAIWCVLEYSFRELSLKKISLENANFKMYPYPQKLNYLQKKSYPPPATT